MEYRATLDTTSKIVTAFAILVIGAVVWLVVSLVIHEQNVVKIIVGGFLGIVIPMSALIFAFLLSPQKYVVENDKITVKRGAGDVSIDLTLIASVARIGRNSLGTLTRSFGSGGLFGYFGEFTSSQYGPMKWYATRGNNYIILQMKDGQKILLTPDNTQMELDLKNKLSL